MIMKFDHVTYIVQQQELNKVLNQFEQELTLHFKEISKDNFPVKWRLMHENQEKYDLYFLKGRLPIEIISYAAVFRGEQLKIDMADRMLYAKSNDILSCLNILKLIGIKEIIQDNNSLKCNLRGVFDKGDYWFVVTLDKNIRTVYLDDEGFGCITFLVDNIERIKEKLHNIKGVDVITNPESVKVNNRGLKISFLRLNVLNVIFEFITPLKHIAQI